MYMPAISSGVISAWGENLVRPRLVCHLTTKRKCHFPQVRCSVKSKVYNGHNSAQQPLSARGCGSVLRCLARARAPWCVPGPSAPGGSVIPPLGAGGTSWALRAGLPSPGSFPDLLQEPHFEPHRPSGWGGQGKSKENWALDWVSDNRICPQDNVKLLVYLQLSDIL